MLGEVWGRREVAHEGNGNRGTDIDNASAVASPVWSVTPALVSGSNFEAQGSLR